ncbi:PepSY domain-containing protein [Sphingomonas gilva]|uniref:PepSY domain-containing protein n=1 Tax=Sphingomonas gilva TaxID=2305907 RepID=UPI001CA3C3F2|nr:PepSY domain-containing protein [Sphingomonas gilva]
MRVALIAGALALAGCSGGDANETAAANGVLPPGPVTNASAVAGEAVPAEVRALAEQTVPGMTIAEAERKEREGRVYYDVEGTRPDGSEVELDMLEEKGAFRVVEIQRDIAWSEAPAAAIAAARAAAGAFAPERVIESTQTDGTVIYELFAPGRTDEPAMEVRMKDGKAELLGERWAH